MQDMAELPDCRKRPVLVVDDDVGMARVAARLLREIGFGRVESADNAAAAVQKLSTTKFDVVISDCNMEPMTGLELLQHIRKDRHLQRTSFVMVTGNNDPQELAAAKAAGVDGYLLKPFNFVAFKRQLARALTRLG